MNLKKVELPVKQIVSGKRIIPSGTLLNPDCLEYYYRFAKVEDEERAQKSNWAGGETGVAYMDAESKGKREYDKDDKDVEEWGKGVRIKSKEKQEYDKDDRDMEEWGKGVRIKPKL